MCFGRKTKNRFENFAFCSQLFDCLFVETHANARRQYAVHSEKGALHLL